MASLFLASGALTLLLCVVWPLLPLSLLLALLLWPVRLTLANLDTVLSGSTIHHHSAWPWVLVVGIPATDVHRVARLPVHAWDERNPEQLHLRAVALRSFRHHALEITVGLWDTLHRTWTHDKRLLAGGSHWP